MSQLIKKKLKEIVNFIFEKENFQKKYCSRNNIANSTQGVKYGVFK